MESAGWKWSIIAAIHSDEAVELSVEAGGRPFASGELLAPLEVITAVMAALANFDEGDSVTVVVHGRLLPMTTWAGTNAYTALYWLATALSKSCCVPVRAPAFDAFGEPATGVRPKLGRVPARVGRAGN
jgi:hypothetical protein